MTKQRLTLEYEYKGEKFFVNGFDDKETYVVFSNILLDLLKQVGKSHRSGAEFSKRIKNEERRKWHSKNPGREKASLEVNHILPIKEGLKRGVSKRALKSQQNAVAVEFEFHKQIHREMNEETLDCLTSCLLNQWKRLI